MSAVTATKTDSPKGPLRIVFYDGECGFCNKSVWFLLRRDSQARLFFAPLQGEHAKRFLPEHLRSRESLDTMVYATISDGELIHFYLRSSAVLLALRDAGGWGSMLAWSRIVPVGLRDMCYRWIAKRRHRLGSLESCPIPNAEERKRFLS